MFRLLGITSIKRSITRGYWRQDKHSWCSNCFWLDISRTVMYVVFCACGNQNRWNRDVAALQSHTR